MADVKRVSGALLGAIAWWLVSCREIPAPEGGVAALSPILLPSPGLVAGDTMRDSIGLVAPLRITAYGADGEALSPQPPLTFVVLDTGAHLAGDLLVGDDAGTTVRVVATVGSLQSQFASVKVTATPETIVAADSVLHRKSYSINAGDTASISPELGVLVQNLAGSTAAGVEAVIVRYAIDQAPVGNGSGPTVVLASGNVRSSRDTTDASGRAARTARLRIAALSPPFAVDTVVVSATAAYRGVSLGTVFFTIIYTNQP
jgi:hypothetical protein